MVTMTASINAGNVARFNSALKEYADSLGNEIATAPRRAAIQICKSFRSKTRPAKQNKGLFTTTSTIGPQYITYKDGRKLNVPLRRMAVHLKDRNKNFARYVYAGSMSEMKRQIRQDVGTNYYPVGAATSKGNAKKPQKKGGHRGLAKQSWGWVMHNISIGAEPDAPWQRRKNDRRNPKDATRDSTSSSRTSITQSSGFARIANRLDYIVDALKGFSVDEAITKATNWILHEAKRRRPKV